MAFHISLDALTVVVRKFRSVSALMAEGSRLEGLVQALCPGAGGLLVAFCLVCKRWDETWENHGERHYMIVNDLMNCCKCVAVGSDLNSRKWGWFLDSPRYQHHFFAPRIRTCQDP